MFMDMQVDYYEYLLPHLLAIRAIDHAWSQEGKDVREELSRDIVQRHEATDLPNAAWELDTLLVDMKRRGLHVAYAVADPDLLTLRTCERQMRHVIGRWKGTDTMPYCVNPEAQYLCNKNSIESDWAVDATLDWMRAICGRHGVQLIDYMGYGAFSRHFGIYLEQIQTFMDAQMSLEDISPADHSLDAYIGYDHVCTRHLASIVQMQDTGSVFTYMRALHQQIESATFVKSYIADALVCNVPVTDDLVHEALRCAYRDADHLVSTRRPLVIPAALCELEQIALEIF
jgi:hypothetical protein